MGWAGEMMIVVQLVGEIGLLVDLIGGSFNMVTPTDENRDKKSDLFKFVKTH